MTSSTDWEAPDGFQKLRLGLKLDYKSKSTGVVCLGTTQQPYQAESRSIIYFRIFLFHDFAAAFQFALRVC